MLVYSVQKAARELPLENLNYKTLLWSSCAQFFFQTGNLTAQQEVASLLAVPKEPSKAQLIIWQ